MTTSTQSPADVINQVLVDIGYPLRIGTLFDGSTAAKKSLDIYGQTRDELLRETTPGFAQREVSLTVLKSAPAGGYIPPTTWDPATNPQLPWAFEYGYPVDAILIGSVRLPPLFLLDFDPKPRVFLIANDNQFNPPQKVILSNVPNAVATYTGRVTDPATWEASFVGALVGRLSRRLTVALADPRLLQAMVAEEQSSRTTEKVIEG